MEERTPSLTEQLLKTEIPLVQLTSPAMGPVTVGSDPEFVYMDRHGNVIAAQDRDIRGIGYDGASTPAELRPGHSPDVATHVARISRALAMGNGCERDATIRWRAAPLMRGVSLGGHLHFGVPSQGDIGTIHRDPRLQYSGALYGAALGPIVTVVEGTSGALRRSGHYGSLRDLRGEYRGEHYVMEWRAPGTWLASPEVATGLLLGGQALTQLFLQAPKFMEALAGDANFIGYSGRRMPGSVRRHYMQPNAAMLLRAIEELLPDEAQKQSWVNLLGMAFNGTSMKYQRDIRSAWGVMPELDIGYLGRDKRIDLPEGSVETVKKSALVWNHHQPQRVPLTYEGFSVRTSRVAPHQVAKLAWHYMQVLGLPVTPIHLYILSTERGTRHWVSPAFEPVLAFARKRGGLVAPGISYEVNAVGNQEGELAIGLCPRQLMEGRTSILDPARSAEDGHFVITAGIDRAARFVAMLAGQAAVLKSIAWQPKSPEQLEDEEYRGSDGVVIVRDADEDIDTDDDEIVEEEEA